MVPEPAILDRDRGCRQRAAGRRGAAARRRCRHRWRRCGRCGPAASGWAGGRRRAPIRAAAGRGRTRAAPASADQQAPDGRGSRQRSSRTARHGAGRGRRRQRAAAMRSGDRVAAGESTGDAAALDAWPRNTPIGPAPASGACRCGVAAAVIARKRKEGRMKGLFIDAGDELAAVFRRVVRPDDPPVDGARTGRCPAGRAARPARRLRFRARRPHADADRRDAPMPGLKHVMFLGTGARSYMDPEALADLGITVHIIKGYGDTAVAEHTIALMWAAARGLARMDRGMRRGRVARAPRACSSPARRSACSGSAASRRRWRGSRAARGCGCWPGTARRSGARRDIRRSGYAAGGKRRAVACICC